MSSICASVWSRSFCRLVSGPVGLVSVAVSAVGGMIGCVCPWNDSASLGLVAPSEIGWAWIVPERGLELSR